MKALTTIEALQLFSGYVTDLIALISCDGRIQYASPSFQHVLGYDPAALISQPAHNQVHPDDLNALEALAARALADGVASGVYRWRHADGSWRWIALRATRADDPPATVLVGHDITERRPLEAELFRSQSLAPSDLVHDVNNLLTAIAGFAELGRCALPPDHPVRDDLNEICTASARAAMLISALRCVVAWDHRDRTDDSYGPPSIPMKAGD